MDLLPVMDALVPVVAALPDAVLQLDVHDEIFEAGNHWYAPELGASCSEYDRHSHVDVRVHPYFTDDELWDYLSVGLGLRAALPFRHPFGWLEACFDLGTAVSCRLRLLRRATTMRGLRLHRGVVRPGLAAPRCADPLRPVGRRPRGTRARWAERRTERTGSRRAHREIYEAAAPMSAPLSVALIASNRFPSVSALRGRARSPRLAPGASVIRTRSRGLVVRGSGPIPPRPQRDDCQGVDSFRCRPSGSVGVAAAFMADHHAYLSLMLQLADPAAVST